MKTRAKNRRGYVLVTAAFLLMVFLAFLGLAIDLGYFFYVRRQMQKATDAAAIGGAHAVELGQTGAQVVQAGRNHASLNGFTDNTNSIMVTINNPPVGGLYVGDARAVEAIINQPVPTLFMKAFGMATVLVRTRAVGRLGSSQACIFALNPSVADAISVGGTALVNSKCGVVDDSSNSAALDVFGSGCLLADSISVTGNFSGGVSSGTCPGISPAPAVSQPPQPDPLAYIQVPNYSAVCDATNTWIQGPATLNPGVYCGGIGGNAQANITFNPGVYILAGGGFSFNGGATLSGTGVMFYNTSPLGSTKACGQVWMAGNSTINLTAPTTGPLAGILFFQDRTCATAAYALGTNGQGYTGALYFPAANLYYGGTSSAAAYSIVVADTLTFQGTPVFNDNYSSLPGGSPIKGVVLGE